MNGEMKIESSQSRAFGVRSGKGGSITRVLELRSRLEQPIAEDWPISSNFSRVYTGTW